MEHREVPQFGQARRLGVSPSREPDGVNWHPPEERAQTRANRGTGHQEPGESPVTHTQGMRPRAREESAQRKPGARDHRAVRRENVGHTRPDEFSVISGRQRSGED